MVLGFYGASGLGAEFYEIALSINETSCRWERFLFVDDDPEKIGTEIVGLPVISFADSITRFGKSGIEFIISVGEPNVKGKVYKKIKDNGCKMTNLILPDAIIAHDTKMGEGIVVQRRNPTAITVQSTYGNNVLIQSCVCMGHGLEIGDNVVISSFDFIGGDTKIGKNTYIGPHACLRNGISIGENCVIGMGSVVTKSIPDNSVAYGNPAKIIKTIEGENRVFDKGKR